MNINQSGLNWKILILKGWFIASLCIGFADRNPIESIESWNGYWSFDGFNDGINIGMDDNIEFLGGFTVDLRFRYSRRQANSELFHLKLGGTVMSAYILPGTYDLAVDFLGPDNSLYRHQFPFPGISDKWHHLTICLNRSIPAKAYFDGVTVQADKEIENTISEIPSNHLHLGGTGNMENSRFAGDIDSIRFWNRMLSEEDLKFIAIKNHSKTAEQQLVNWTFPSRDLSPLAKSFLVETKGNPTWKRPEISLNDNVVIHGIITDSQGIPLRMQRVELRSKLQNFAPMMTNDKGVFTRLIKRIPQQIRLSVHNENTCYFSSPVEISKSTPHAIDLSLSLSDSPMVEGFVRAKDEQTPITGVEVLLESLDHPETIGRLSSFSDLSGRFYFSGIPPGAYRITPLPSKWALFQDHDVFFGQSNFSRTIQVGSVPIVTNFNIVPSKLGRWRHFGLDDNLPSNLFEYITISKDQSLWTGNMAQLYHYQGNRFHRVPIELASHEKIVGIATSPISGCYVALENGRIFLVNKSGIIKKFTSPERTNIQTVMLTKDDQFFIATITGIYVANLSEIQALDNPEPSWELYSPVKAHGLTQSKDGSLWASSTRGVIRINEESEKSIQMSSGLENAFILSVIESKDTKALFIVSTHSIYKLVNNEFVKIALPQKFNFNHIKSIEALSEKELWIGTENDGLWKMSDKTWTHYSMADGLPSNNIISLHSDNIGNIWIGTVNGLSRLDDQSWITIGPQMGLPKTEYFSLTYNPSNNSLYAGTAWKGIVQLNSTNVISHPKPEFGRNQLTQEGKPLVMLGNHLAIKQPNEEGFNEIVQKLPYSSWLLTGDFDPSGNLWLGRQWSGGGLIKMNWSSDSVEPEFETMWTEEDGLGNANIWSIWAESSQRIWLATEKGIYIKTQDDWIDVPHQNPGINYQAMYILPTESGEIWVGTNKGIGKIEQGRFTPYPTGTLLDETLVWTMHQDSEGKIRVGTNASGLYTIHEGMVSHLTIESGLSGNSIYDMAEHPKGIMWFANEYGIDRHIAKKHPLKAYFQSIRGDQIYDPNKKLPELNANSRLVFGLRSSNIASPKQNSKYCVKITPSSDSKTKAQTFKLNDDRFEWVPTESGDYTIELTSYDQNLFESDPAYLNVKVVPLWYRNITLMAPLCLGAMAGLVWLTTLLLKGVKHRKEARILREELLNQETKTRQHLETVNKNLNRAQQEALIAKKDAEKASDAKSLFLAKMSHEIRTPLNAVLGYSQILKGKAKLDDLTVTGLAAIENSGQHLLEIINDILTLSKIESGHVELQTHDFALSELIDSISEMVSLNCKKKGLQWRIQCTESYHNKTTGKYEMKELAIKPPWPRLAFHADISKVRQILLNLLTNAIKFTKEGSITLEIRIQNPTTPQSIPAPLEVYFAVTDTGLGMEQDDIQRVFGAFEQGKISGSGEQKGIGLGLSIARRLVEVLGGKLSCYSKPTKGSRFQFTLPLAQAKYHAVLRPVSQRKPCWRGTPPTALIVDDLEQNSLVLKRLLNLLDIVSESVQSGHEAIQYLQQNKTDVIFMDIMMPKMTGIEAFRTIRQSFGPAIPKCIAYSAHVLDHEKEIYDEALFDGMLAKPIDLDELIGLLSQLFADRISSKSSNRNEMKVDMDIQLLKPHIKKQLIDVSERYAVTELMRKVDELQSNKTLSFEACQLLISLGRSGDMEKLIRILQKN